MMQSAPAVLLAVLIASAPIDGYSQVRTAPTVAMPSGSNADLRPAYATSQDIAEGKRVA